MEFVLGGIAASCAGIFTNPLEVLKTRMQFEGELKAKGTHPIYYRNIVNATLVIAKNEGIFALQKGLVSATCVQFIMNGSRLGSCTLLKQTLQSLTINKFQDFTIILRPKLSITMRCTKPY